VRSLFFVMLVILAGCTTYKTQPVSEPVKPRWEHFDSTAIYRTKLLATSQVKKFYRENNFQLVWLDTGGLTSAADSMISFIRSAKFYGLNPADYHLAELGEAHRQPLSKDEAVATDLYLTDSFFACFHHLKNGRIEKRSLNPIDLSEVYSEEASSILTEALPEGSHRRFLEQQEPLHQQYHDLKAELKKIIGKKKNSALEIDQLMVNMERWRWQKKSYPERYIVVNIPSLMLKVVDTDSVWLESKVIVGKRETQTPELESIIKSFIIYPYWHVPKSIVKEILPAIQKDSLYMRKHNYEVLDLDGKVVDAKLLDWPSFNENNFPYVLRQREGSENTMGVIKFVFANNYGVYLHDTNARGLFRNQKRDLSHGCIRVHKAVELAHYLAKDDDTYVGPEDLDQYLIVQHKMTVDVVKPVLLILEYFTTSTDGDEVVFYKDIYGKDQDILNAWYHYSLHANQEVSSSLI
jgi:L,D-transpeptidase YcbB